MKKVLLGLFLVAVLGCNQKAEAADVVVSITVPDAKVSRVSNAFQAAYPIPTDEFGAPLFTPKQWVKKKLVEFIIETVRSVEDATRIKTLNDKIDNEALAEDPSLAS